MSRQLTGAQVREIFETCGFEGTRQAGSHETMTNEEGVNVTVASHGSAPLRTGTLKAMFDQVAQAVPPEAQEVLADILSSKSSVPLKKHLKSLSLAMMG